MASVELQQGSDYELDESLNKLERFLGLLGFCQYTFSRAFLSWLVFSVLAVVLPLSILRYSPCTTTPTTPNSSCNDTLEIHAFQLEIIVSRALVAAVSLACISRKLRKYRIRNALFVDRCRGQSAHYRKHYLQKIRRFYRLLASWFGICIALKVARETTLNLSVHHDEPWWLIVIVFFASIVSWAYTTLVFLAGCTLFNLVGNLQVIHFENYGKILEKDLDVSVYIEEHMSLTHNLSKISHRFRIFLLSEFLIVTVSQFITLLRTTENQGIINFMNAGDFAVLSIVELVGIVMCLTAAATISHRAQSLGSIASRWHALVSSNNFNDASGHGDNGGNSEFSYPVGPLTVNYSESDLESADYMALPSNVLLTSSTPYQKRQAFVTYVQSNTGGFTIFGWLVDRMLINTVFFIELSLAFFVLGKTIIITVR